MGKAKKNVHVCYVQGCAYPSVHIWIAEDNFGSFPLLLLSTSLFLPFSFPPFLPSFLHSFVFKKVFPLNLELTVSDTVVDQQASGMLSIEVTQSCLAFFPWMLGINTEDLMLEQQILYPLSNFPSPVFKESQNTGWEKGVILGPAFVEKVTEKPVGCFLQITR